MALFYLDIFQLRWGKIYTNNGSLLSSVWYRIHTKSMVINFDLYLCDSNMFYSSVITKILIDMFYLKEIVSSNHLHVERVSCLSKFLKLTITTSQ